MIDAYKHIGRSHTLASLLLGSGIAIVCSSFDRDCAEHSVLQFLVHSHWNASNHLTFIVIFVTLLLYHLLSFRGPWQSAQYHIRDNHSRLHFLWEPRNRITRLGISLAAMGVKSSFGCRCRKKSSLASFGWNVNTREIVWLLRSGDWSQPGMLMSSLMNLFSRCF